MHKGKRFNLPNSSHTIFKFIIFIFAIFILSFAILFISHFIHKFQPNDAEQYVHSPIEISKRIIGLEEIEISSMNIKSSEQSSIIEISFKNISDNIVNSCEINLYLLDETESVVFATSLELPDISPNVSETFNVLCSSNITNIVDYKVVFNN